MEYDPTQFTGTAPFYLRGRPPYSAELADVVRRELDLDGRGRLVDVGCGPGTVGVALARLFERVTFVEPDADMLAAARAHAAGAGLMACDFLRTTAEQLAGRIVAPVRVVTFGQSFHRTDKLHTADGVHDVLAPGGSMVVINHDPSRPAPPQPAHTSLIPHDDVRDLIRAFLGAELRSGARPVSAYDAEPVEDVLSRTCFGRPRVAFAPGRPDIVRDVDGVVAGYLSMSFAAPHLFGPRLPEFVRELRALLERHAPNGRFWDWPGDTKLIIATRTAGPT